MHNLQPHTKEVSESNIACGRLGNYKTRLAHSAEDVEAAQALRYQVFCQELHAEKNSERERFQREADAHDLRCDHLLLITDSTSEETNTSQANEALVGTQRFLVRKGEAGPSDFYSKDAFEISKMLSRFPDKRFMELGRSCILPKFRDKRTMELLWHGTWDYAVKNRVDVMFGCASFHSLEPEEISEALGFLAEHAPLKEEWMMSSQRTNKINMLDYIGVQKSAKSAIRSLPPLIKGYLRLGAMFSIDAVPDPDFGTIDVLVVLPTANINPRYVNYYGANADRHSV